MNTDRLTCDNYEQYFCSLVLLTSCLLAHSGQAQQVIPVVDKMLRDSIGENATRNGKQAGHLTFIRRMTKNTRDDVSATQRLQYDYRAFLKQTGSTASLEVSNAQTEQQAVGLAMTASDHLGCLLVRSEPESSVPGATAADGKESDALRTTNSVRRNAGIH